jgi:hypothetical protein
VTREAAVCAPRIYAKPPFAPHARQIGPVEKLEHETKTDCAPTRDEARRIATNIAKLLALVSRRSHTTAVKQVIL